jgi:hypothetical protein
MLVPPPSTPKLPIAGCGGVIDAASYISTVRETPVDPLSGSQRPQVILAAPMRTGHPFFQMLRNWLRS